MNIELDKKLAGNFPSILGEYFHIECDDGWHDLIYNLCSEIKAYEATKVNDPIYVPVQAQQIKEKFGALIFYYSGGDEFIFKLTQKYYLLSLSTCEHTGGLGSMHRNGYCMKTLSDFSAALLGFKK